MDPIINLSNAIMANEKDKAFKIMDARGIVLKEAQKEKVGKDLLKCVFQKWLNAADALLEMICLKLPSPRDAQKYRVDSLYEGPTDDVCATAMRNCDATGPLMIYISKMVDIKGKFYAFGRVFSGTVKSGQQVRILGSNFK